MKTYLTRSQSKAFAMMDGGYIGDPTGGAAYGEFNDPVTAVVAGGSIISGLAGAGAARSAASAQSDAATRASDAQLAATRESNAMQQKMYDEKIKRQDPYLHAGNTALKDLQGGVAAGGQFTQNFAPSDLAMDPSYKWRLQQGTQNLNAVAAARGLLGSGQNLKDITDYGQGAASQEYGNAYNRYRTNREDLYSKLAGLTQMGQNTATDMGTSGMNMAQSMGNNTMQGTHQSNDWLTSGAGAYGAGQIGSVNALSGALQGGLGNWMGMQNMNAMNSMAGGSGSGAVDMTGFRTPQAPITYQGSGGGLGSGLYGL